MEDPRFSHISTDPRFKAVPRRKRKVTVDTRFKSMFTDKRFQVKYKTDKRGSAVQESSSENLRKYYDISTADDDDDSNLEDKVKERDNEIEENVEEEEEDSDINEDQEDDNDSEEREKDEEEEESESDIESDASSTDIDDDDLLDTLTKDGVFSQWLDETEAVPQSESTGYRLALCNMNWDRVNAVDLYVLFNSFKPTVGMVKSVTIYPSDFGQERLREEETHGPTELVKTEQSYPEEENDPTLSEDQGSSAYYEKLREYQLKRLSYYYAIIECDSVATAEHIYEECDGLELELSSSTLDLRFVPEDMTFTDRKPSSVATESSLTKDYEPPEFMTSALQQSKVQLTWDETNPARLKKTMRQHNKEDLNNIDFDTFLGSSSDDEQQTSKEDSVKKYRSLLGLQDNGGDTKEEEEEEELEITWNIGLNEGKKTIDEKDTMPLNDDNDKGFDDPFFSDKKSIKRKKKKLNPEEEKQIQKEKEELELLVLSDTEDTRDHFSLKQIMKEEKKESAKLKRRKRKEKTKGSSAVSDFEVDLNDPRFSALYESHHYAIEPSSQQYKATKGMKKLLNERQKRRKIDTEEATENVVHDKQPETSLPSSPKLQTLVKSVKSKADSLKKRKQILAKNRKIRK